ncbi:hypothetical protein [Paludisphaera mucosa]|uniref:Uncharacterized protein n=1 Tax=Paludisphaera mucosa TaxID=3030827 RepID=A0ABT6FGQ3_9BACT|nr:hypothetical protein [Paludisphaera mucosa]MDG3006766.1 hypothetical protein [Paludisphaera mucosa]
MNAADTFYLVAWLWLMHVVVALVLGSRGIEFARARLTPLDSLTFVVPFGIWAAMFFFEPIPKSLGNLAESLFLGAALGTAFLIRPFLASADRKTSAALVTLLVMCLAAVALYAFMPPLGDE